MADFDLEAVAARHRNLHQDGLIDRCSCGKWWEDCDAAQAVEALRERDEKIRNLQEANESIAEKCAVLARRLTAFGKKGWGNPVRVRGET